jgi:cytochrome c biogenesis protein CcmG/thiol:disulfide interchange protein DsbE
MKRWWAFLPLALFAVLFAVALVRLNDAAQAPAGVVFASPERPAPAHVFPGMDGPDLALASGGEPMLVNFFASWCTPCKAEHPLLIEMAAEGASVAGVLYKDTVDHGRALLAADGNPFAVVGLDPDGAGGLAFGIAGVPETFLVDRNGRIVKTHRGPLDGAKAREMLDAWRALKSAPATSGGAGR